MLRGSADECRAAPWLLPCEQLTAGVADVGYRSAWSGYVELAPFSGSTNTSR